MRKRRGIGLRNTKWPTTKLTPHHPAQQATRQGRSETDKTCKHSEAVRTDTSWAPRRSTNFSGPTALLGTGPHSWGRKKGCLKDVATPLAVRQGLLPIRIPRWTILRRLSCKHRYVSVSAYVVAHRSQRHRNSSTKIETRNQTPNETND